MNKQQNIFVSFLTLLNVKHTTAFSNQYFNEHPHKYNLLGLSKMLSEYGVEHAATRITDKEKDIKQSNCNSVLESSAAKLFGIIGWAEVGLGYFLINVFILLFAPTMTIYIALINILALPYAFWSVWYQYKKGQQIIY